VTVIMALRRTWIGTVALAMMGVMASGCLPIRKEVRPTAQDVPPLVESDEKAGKDDPTGTKKLTRDLFRSSGRPGGWSTEANEIEDHLGVR
jgi:hypothetical protein